MARARKGYSPRKENLLKGTGYDSMFEKHIHENKLQESRFHSKQDYVSYTVPHTYQPDFVLEKDGKVFFIETKGRFRDSSEARKYLFVREVLKEKEELVFVWEKPNTPFPFSKKRKDGTRATHQEWAEKNGFRNWNQTEFTVEDLIDK